MPGRGRYTVGEVAAIIGVTAHTIRAWERRHEVVKPLRSTSGQRRYRTEDVELLREVKQAVIVNGLSLKLASRLATGSEAIEIPASVLAARRRPRSPYSGNENMWRGVVDVMPELVFLVDPSGRVLEANTATAKLFGLTVQKFRGRQFVDFVEPFDRAKAVLMYRPSSRAVRGWELNLSTPSQPRMYSFQSWLVRRDGSDALAFVGAERFTEPIGTSDVAAESALAKRISGAGIFQKWLTGLMADPRFHEVITARQLSEVAMQHLQELLPATECAIAVATPPGSPRPWADAYSRAALKALAAEPAIADAYKRAIRGVASIGAREEIPTTVRGHVRTVTAVPFSPRRRLGVLAWSRPSSSPLSHPQVMALDAFLAWIAVASDRLQVRSESHRQSSRFDQMVKAASVVRDLAEPGAISTGFLKQLAQIVGVDTAAIGRIVGHEFVVEAVYTPGGTITRPGGKFPLLTIFREAVRKGAFGDGEGRAGGTP